jgi:hypothetical protein
MYHYIEQTRLYISAHEGGSKSVNKNCKGGSNKPLDRWRIHRRVPVLQAEEVVGALPASAVLVVVAVLVLLLLEEEEV